jgi:hypothetical protein
MTAMTADELIVTIDRIDTLLSTPDRWTQDAGARNAAGAVCDPLSPDAVCWCLIGASWCVTWDNDKHRVVMGLFHKALNALGVQHETVGEYNDRGTFDKIKRLITDARALAV